MGRITDKIYEFMRHYLENKIFDSSALRLTSPWSLLPHAVLHQRACRSIPWRTISVYHAGQLWANDTSIPCFSGERSGKSFCTFWSLSFVEDASILSASIWVIAPVHFPFFGIFDQ